MTSNIIVVLIVFLTLNVSSIFSFELECPYGCGNSHVNSQAGEITQKFINCLKELNFYNRRYNFQDTYFAWYISLQQAYLNPEDIPDRYYYIFHDDDSEYFDIGFYPDILRMFSYLQEDLTTYFDNDIKYYQKEIKKTSSDIEWLKGIVSIDSFPIIRNKILKENFEKDLEYHSKQLIRIKDDYTRKQKYVFETEKAINKIYWDMVDFCIAEHQWVGSFYQRGLFNYNLGNNEDCLKDIFNFILNYEKINPKEKNEIKADILLLKGQCQIELGLYHDAVIALTEAIQENQENIQEAYLERAGAFFELGEFESSLKDYLSSKIKPQNSELEIKDVALFSQGFTIGAANGATLALEDYIPSLLSSFQGLGHALWSFAQDPIQISSDFFQAVHESIDYLKSNTPKETLKKIIPELRELIENWSTFDQQQKGEKTGYIIGKYGIEIFSGAGIAKCMKIYRNLKRANNLLTLEAMALSAKNRSIIKLEALKKAEARKKILEQRNLKIQMDKQAKHIRGYKNFDPLRSEFTHSNPQNLVNQFAGKGQKVNNKFPGELGYKERIDFGEVIGIFRDESEKIISETTMGMIVYAEDGVHIIPVRPKGF